MSDKRAVPRSVGSAFLQFVRTMSLAGLCAGAGTFLFAGCTDDSGNGHYQPLDATGAAHGWWQAVRVVKRRRRRRRRGWRRGWRSGGAPEQRRRAARRWRGRSSGGAAGAAGGAARSSAAARPAGAGGAAGSGWCRRRRRRLSRYLRAAGAQLGRVHAQQEATAVGSAVERRADSGAERRPRAERRGTRRSRRRRTSRRRTALAMSDPRSSPGPPPAISQRGAPSAASAACSASVLPLDDSDSRQRPIRIEANAAAERRRQQEAAAARRAHAPRADARARQPPRPQRRAVDATAPPGRCPSCPGASDVSDGADGPAPNRAVPSNSPATTISPAGADRDRVPLPCAPAERLRPHAAGRPRSQRATNARPIGRIHGHGRARRVVSERRHGR